MGDITILSKSITIPAAMMGEADLVVTLVRDGYDEPWHPGKPRYTWSITDGTTTIEGDDLCGYGDGPEMARSLCSFLSNDVERHDYAERNNGRNVDGDPLPDYTPEQWAFLIDRSETLSSGSIGPDDYPGEGD